MEMEPNDDDKVLTQKIRMMTNARRSLNSVIQTDDDDEWKRILFLIEKYIETYCQHFFVEDMIDINCEQSQRIRYCIYCEKTI